MESEKKLRKRFDKQFKENAVRLVTHGGKKATEVARDLGIGVNSLYNWKAQMEANGVDAFPGKGRLMPQDEELRRLQRELAEAQEERDILKKALAFFSKNAR